LLLAAAPPSSANEKHKCDENNSGNKSIQCTSSTDAEKPSSSSCSINKNDDVTTADDEHDEKSEKIKKPKQMVGLFPLDLRSELKQRVGGGKIGFALKKSSTNADVIRDIRKSTEPIAIANKSNDLLRAVQQREFCKQDSKDDSDDDETAGVENLSFKEKLLLIERSSSRSLVNPL
jgi:hypothetical protein